MNSRKPSATEVDGAALRMRSAIASNGRAQFGSRAPCAKSSSPRVTGSAPAN